MLRHVAPRRAALEALDWTLRKIAETRLSLVGFGKL
jgi:hypothetical protein